jgi:hypothetical protein
VRFDYVASVIVNVNHSIPQPTQWQRIGKQFEAAMIFAVGLRKRALMQSVPETPTKRQISQGAQEAD